MCACGNYGLLQHVAHGTSLALVLGTGLAGLTAYSMTSGTEIDVRNVGILSCAGACTGWLGARATGFIKPHTITLLMGFVWRLNVSSVVVLPYS